MILAIILVNSILPRLSFAANTTPEQVTAQDTYDPLRENFLGTALDGLLGIVLIPAKLLLLVPGVLINLILSSIASIGGQWDTITIEKIFFNEVKLTDINIFKIEGTDTIQTIRTAIAEFYIAFRNLAIVLSLAALIYIGIRMAINSTAEDKAKYKEMLWNWLVGFGLIFILHYIIIITINANEMIVSSFNTITIEQSDYMTQLLKQAWWIPFTTSFASIVMYGTLLIMTFIFLVIYIKRMLTISFLIVVAPLISVTYAIDKVGNNKSEILDTWLKEFMYNVLIQPFHCLIYSAFIGIGMNLIAQKGSLDFGAMTFAIILTFSIFLGQKMIREIFGFSNSKSLTQKVAVIALAKKTVGNVKNIVALKDAKNELRAKENRKGLPSQMPDGTEASLENLVRMRRIAAQHEENVPSPNQNQGQNPMPNQRQTAGGGTGTTQSSVRKRRRIRKAPRIVKKTVRWYGDALGTMTGYNMIKGMRKKRRANEAYKMTKEDYWIAASENYRQSQDRKMSNAQLVSEMERLYDIDIQDIQNPEELNYKLFIESMKSNFNKDEMRDMILNGSSQNERWRK